MKFIIVGVEGDSTEPAGIKGILSALRQQSPNGYRYFEVIPLSLGGNHGHGERLAQKFNQVVNDYMNSPESCIEPEDEIIKYLVCDYDYMHEHGVQEGDFRQKIQSLTGAIPLITKPKFEYLVASIFYGQDSLRDLLANGSSLNNLISDAINKYNLKCEFEFQKISPYPFSKKTYQSEQWFGHIFTMDPELARRVIEIEADNREEYYTEIPILLREIAKNFKNGSNL